MSRVTEAQAEAAGREAGYFGSNLTNCHFTYFATPDLTKAWERGNASGKNELSHHNAAKAGRAEIEAEIDAEVARIMAMTPEEIDAHIRAQGDAPAEVVRRFDLIVGNAITIVKLRTALKALADRVELCGKESAGIFQIAAIHGCPYNGPHWVNELEAARAALKN